MPDSSLAGGALFSGGGAADAAKEVGKLGSAIKGVGTAFASLGGGALAAITKMNAQVVQLTANATAAARAVSGISAAPPAGIHSRGYQAPSWGPPATAASTSMFSQGNSTGNGGIVPDGGVIPATKMTSSPVGGDTASTNGGVDTGGGFGTSAFMSQSGFNTGRAVAAGAVAASGIAGRAASGLSSTVSARASTGLSWQQLGAQGALAEGKGLGGARSFENYAKQFTGWGGQMGNKADVGNLNAGFQLLQSPGIAEGSKLFTSRAQQAGAFANISQDLGGNMTFSDAAAVQSNFTTKPGITALQQMGLGSLAVGGKANVFSVSQGLDKQVAYQMMKTGKMSMAQYKAQGGTLNSSQIATQAGVGGGLNTDFSQLGLDAGATTAATGYLEQATSSKGGLAANTLGSSNLTQAQRIQQMNASGFGTQDTSRQVHASEKKANSELPADLTAAATETKKLTSEADLTAAAMKALTSTVNTLKKAVDSFVHGGGPGSLGAAIGGDIDHGVSSGVSAMASVFGGAGNSGGTAGFPTTATTSPTGSGSGAQVVRDAEKFIGVPYVWGGTTPAGFDCSGLVQYAYKEIGVNIARTTFDQVKQGTAVANIGKAQLGDLLFYAGSDGTASNPGHVGMYAGGGKMVVAPQTGQDIQMQSIGSPVAIRRYLPSNGSAGTGTTVSASGAGQTGTSGSGWAGNISSSNNGVALGEGTSSTESATITSMLLAPPTGMTGPTSASGSIGNANGGTSGNGGNGGTGAQIAPSGIAVLASNAANQAMAKRMAAAYSTAGVNWATGSEWIALNNVAMAESGWSNTVWNGGSHAALEPAGHPAYGIAQSDPFSKYPKKGQPPGYGGTADPETQINWMLSYIKGKWVDPIGAWTRGEQTIHSYDVGTQYVTEDQTALIHKGELIIPAASAAAMKMNQMSSTTSGSGGVVFQKGAVVFTITTGTGGATGAGTTAGLPSQQQMEQAADYFAARVEKKLNMKAMASE